MLPTIESRASIIGPARKAATSSVVRDFPRFNLFPRRKHYHGGSPSRNEAEERRNPRFHSQIETSTVAIEIARGLCQQCEPSLSRALGWSESGEAVRATGSWNDSARSCRPYPTVLGQCDSLLERNLSLR